MATTNFTTGTVITSDWANDVDAVVYEGNWPTGVNPKTDTIAEETAATGVTVDGVLLKDSQVSTDQINEKTATAGVTIDGVLLKDSQVTTDQINEKTGAAGVTIDGVLLKDSQVTTDVINEKTAATGVTIDSVQLKDGTAVMTSPFNFRNKIINGNFNFWQRGTSLGSGTGVRYLADRFFSQSTGSTYTVSRQAFTLGQTDVPGEPTYFHRVVVTSVANAANLVLSGQYVESVKTLAGKSAVLTFYAKADAAKNIAVESIQNFGTTGSPSAVNTAMDVVTCALTTSWQKFTIPLSIDSITGKTLGSDNNDNLGIIFWFDAGSNYNTRTNSLGQQSGTFDIARVQLEEGSVATPFEERPIGLELNLCERYYQVYISALCVGYAGVGNLTYTDFPYNTSMRANPNITFNTVTYNNASALAINFILTNHVRLQVLVTAAGLGWGSAASMTLDAEL